MNEDMTMEEYLEVFQKDRFATECTGLRIIETAPHYAKVAFDIEDCHKNAAGAVMGGAIFTAADFAFAIASNYNNLQTVGTNCSIQYLSAAKGNQIIAEAKAEKIGRKLCFFTVRVYDELDTQIAIVNCTGYRHG